MIPSAPSGTHRVAVDLLHQLRQAIVLSFSSQLQEVLPVSAICGVGQSAILHTHSWLEGWAVQLVGGEQATRGRPRKYHLA